jgi:hypothetical protein
LKLSRIIEKWGFLSFFQGGDVGFWGKNGAWWVNLLSLGKIGKKKTFKNVRKRSKIFENIRKCALFERKLTKNWHFLSTFLQTPAHLIEPRSVAAGACWDKGREENIEQ